MEIEFRGTMSDASKLKSLSEALSAMVNEVVIVAKKEGLSANAMDASNVSMICFELPASEFSDYNVRSEEGTRMCISAKDLKLALKNVKGSEEIHLELTDVLRLEIARKGSRIKHEMPLISETETQQNVPELTFENSVTMPPSTFKEMIDACSDYSESIIWYVAQQKLVCEGTDEIRKTKIEVYDGENSVTLTVPNRTKEETKSGYSVGFIQKMLMLAKQTEEVKIEWCKDYPLRVSYQIGGMSVRYILAPRVG